VNREQEIVSEIQRERLRDFVRPCRRRVDRTDVHAQQHERVRAVAFDLRQLMRVQAVLGRGFREAEFVAQSLKRGAVRGDDVDPAKASVARRRDDLPDWAAVGENEHGFSEPVASNLVAQHAFGHQCHTFVTIAGPIVILGA